jgi:imidazoleglycerol-phosphate dehydratase
MQRRARIERKTAETEILVDWDLDGRGTSKVETPYPFLDHMLSSMAKHGLFDLTLQAKGDTQIDDHHTIEDLGIALGQSLAQALGERRGIRRFGEANIPLDEALAQVVIDLSGRPCLVYQVRLPRKKIKEFDASLIEHFFKSFVDHSKATLHIRLHYGKDPHHILEAVFKGLGRALEEAVRIDPRIEGIPSTKGGLIV